jgi:hypothetical protein
MDYELGRIMYYVYEHPTHIELDDSIRNIIDNRTHWDMEQVRKGMENASWNDSREMKEDEFAEIIRNFKLMDWVEGDKARLFKKLIKQYYGFDNVIFEFSRDNGKSLIYSASRSSWSMTEYYIKIVLKDNEAELFEYKRGMYDYSSYDECKDEFSYERTLTQDEINTHKLL